MYLYPPAVACPVEPLPQSLDVMYYNGDVLVVVVKCHHCHKMGHFIKCCFKKQKDKKNKGNYDKKDSHGITTTQDDGNNGYSSDDINKSDSAQISTSSRKDSFLDQSKLQRSSKWQKIMNRNIILLAYQSQPRDITNISIYFT